MGMRTQLDTVWGRLGDLYSTDLLVNISPISMSYPITPPVVGKGFAAAQHCKACRDYPPQQPISVVHSSYETRLSLIWDPCSHV